MRNLHRVLSAGVVLLIAVGAGACSGAEHAGPTSEADSGPDANAGSSSTGGAGGFDAVGGAGGVSAGAGGSGVGGTAGSGASGGAGGSTASGGAGGSTASGGAGGSTASGLTKSGRWFTYNGTHDYLVGIDAQQLAADPSLDYVAILDKLQAYRINKVRIWIYPYWSPQTYYEPWAYDASTGKYDLDSWNPTFWSRLQSVIAAAKSRDIIVEVSLFDDYPGDPGWWTSTTRRPAWNKAFNINGAFSTNASGDFYPEFFQSDYSEKTSSGHTVADYQKALVDKVLATVDSFSNIYYEIFNEFPGGGANPAATQDQVHGWQQYWAEYVKQHTSHVVDVHAGNGGGPNNTGYQYYDTQPYVDDIDFHLYEANPDNISSLLHPLQSSGKILQCNESFEWYTNGALDMNKLDMETREAWGWFTSGGYYAVYNGFHTDYSGWSTMAGRLKSLHDLVDKTQWWTMSPVDGSGSEYDFLSDRGPSNHWQILADPGHQYVVYYWDDGTYTPTTDPSHIRLVAGTYSYSWYDPTNAALLAQGSVTSAGDAGFTSISAPSASWNPNVGVVLILLSSP